VAAASIQRVQTGSKAAKPKAVATIAKDVAAATGDQKAAKKAADSAAAADKVAVDKAAADEAKSKAKAAVEKAEALDAARKAAAEANKAKTELMGMTHADGTRRKAVSGEHAVIRRGKWSTWPAVTVVAIAMGVLSMMMVTTAGAQAVEMASSDGSGYYYGWAENADVYDSRGDKVDTIDTIMQRVDLNEVEVQKWQKVETDRVQRFETNNNVEFVSKLGEL